MTSDNHYQVSMTLLMQYIHNCTAQALLRNESYRDIMRNCSNYPDYYEQPLKPEEFLYDVPSQIIVLLSIFYGTISVVAVVGNFLVIWIVTTSRRMQNVTNCFIANLALADIVIGLFAIPFQFQAALLQRWNLPEFMCPFCPFVQVLSVTVSIFTLTAIALDRHRAILNPLRVYPSKYRAKVCIACIWMVGFFIASPMALALRVEDIEYFDPNTRTYLAAFSLQIVVSTTITSGLFVTAGIIHTKPFCYNTELPNEVMLGYRILILLLQYIIPLCIISCVYARMALRLWGSHAPGNAQFIRDATLMKNKKKVIKMLVIVVALFAFCWLPLQTYMVLQDIFPSINKYRYINIVFFFCDWLAMSNSCYNPFIYGIYNEKFKREFQQRFPFRSRKWRSSTVESIETEKTLVAGRPSVRSTTTTIDWRSNNFNNRSTYGRNNTNDNYLNVKNPRKNSKYKDKDLYVLQSARGGTMVRCASESEYEELCL